MKKTPEQKISRCCSQIREEIAHWKYLNQNGCNDPFWPDGCNMNLTRNHIIYYQRELQNICAENKSPLPEEYYFSLPPEVDMNYMANLKQKERVARIFYGVDMPVRKKYLYDERQMSFV